MKSIKEQYQDKAQEALERRPNETLSDNRCWVMKYSNENCEVKSGIELPFYPEHRVKEFIKKLKEEIATTEMTPISDVTNAIKIFHLALIDKLAGGDLI